MSEPKKKDSLLRRKAMKTCISWLGQCRDSAETSSPIRPCAEEGLGTENPAQIWSFSIWNSEISFYCEANQALTQAAQRDCRVQATGGIQKMPEYNPGKLAIAGHASLEGWDKWFQGPSSLNHSVVLWDLYSTDTDFAPGLGAVKFCTCQIYLSCIDKGTKLY